MIAALYPTSGGNSGVVIAAWSRRARRGPRPASAVLSSRQFRAFVTSRAALTTYN